LAIVFVAGLHVALPARYRVQPAWVVPVALLVPLAALIAGDPGRIDRQKTWPDSSVACPGREPCGRNAGIQSWAARTPIAIARATTSAATASTASAGAGTVPVARQKSVSPS